MTIKLDPHGQPVSTRLSNARNITRDISELIGLCRGVVLDSVVTQQEAEGLFEWIHAQPDLVDTWPANVVYQRLKEVLSDGVLDSAEASDLLKLLMDLVSQPDRLESIDTSTGEVLSEAASTALPISIPAEFSIEGLHFVFTGKFASGTRAECEAEITSRGGRCQSRPTKNTRFIVVGSIGSRDWAQSAWGRKIEKAVALKDSGEIIDILSEELWLEYMDVF